MSKKITEQIANLERENQLHREFQKLFFRAVKLEFGIDTQKLHKIIESDAKNHDNFESKIRTFFDLKNEKDIANFIQIMCNDSILNYYRNELLKNEE